MERVGKLRNKYVFVLSMLLILTVCSVFVSSLAGKTRQGKDGILIVTSFYPVYIAALNVTDGVEGAEVRCLSSPAAGCVHDHQLTTEDMILLEQADVFIINGAGMEGYLEAVIERYPKLEVVDSSTGVPLLESGELHRHGEDAQGHEEDEEDAHIHNAHIWMNMENYCIQIGNIGDGLIRLDPTHEKQYGVNVENYKTRVKSLLEEGKRELAHAPERSAVSTHEAFAYFAENFQWEIAATVNMDENTALKASEVGGIIQAVQDGKIPYIFTEELYGQSLSRILEGETDCRTLLLDTLVTGLDNKDSYLAGMRKNIEVLKEAVDNEAG